MELGLIADATRVPVDELLSFREPSGRNFAAKAQPDETPAVDEARLRLNIFWKPMVCFVTLAVCPPGVLPLPLMKGGYLQQASDLADRVRKLAGVGDSYIEELAGFASSRSGWTLPSEPPAGS